MSHRPNVVLFCADDLGYGDLSCYGAHSISTPNVDALAQNGIRFTNTYSTSAVCTPARFSILTGEYPCRNPYTRVLPGNARMIIDTNQQTLPKVFRSAGYTTGVVGKWHLGMGGDEIDWNQPISPNPCDLGFDYSLVFPGTNDRVPCVYVKNGVVENLDPNDPIEVSYDAECPFSDIDTYYKNPEKRKMDSSHGHDNSLLNGVGRIGYMRGGEKAVWRDEDLCERFLSEAKDFIDRSDGPFFLYYPLHQPHVPRIPSDRFRGKSSLGARGDVIMELDWCVGEITRHLEEKGILEDTIIIFTSDNGPVGDDGYVDEAERLMGLHKPAGPLRGGKYSKFDGGARVPFIVSQKGHTEQTTSDALLSHVDLTASFAAMFQIDIPDGECRDSQNMIHIILGKGGKDREDLLYESVDKGYVLRKGNWAYLKPSSGQWYLAPTKTELGNSRDPLLYNMLYDIGQKENLAFYRETIAEEMDARIVEILNS